jgi:hypothetical protein
MLRASLSLCQMQQVTRPFQVLVNLKPKAKALLQSNNLAGSSPKVSIVLQHGLLWL